MTPDEYVAALEPARREVIAPVRAAVAQAMPAGYEETVEFGMIAWVVPLERCPDTYNGRPLMHVALASQKRYCSLYLMGVYADEEESFRARWRGGRRLDMGKSCVRFRAVADLDLPLITETIAATGVEDLIARHAAARSSARSNRPGG